MPRGVQRGERRVIALGREEEDTRRLGRLLEPLGRPVFVWSRHLHAVTGSPEIHGKQCLNRNKRQKQPKAAFLKIFLDVIAILLFLRAEDTMYWTHLNWLPTSKTLLGPPAKTSWTSPCAPAHRSKLSRICSNWKTRVMHSKPSRTSGPITQQGRLFQRRRILASRRQGTQSFARQLPIEPLRIQSGTKRFVSNRRLVPIQHLYSIRP